MTAIISHRIRVDDTHNPKGPDGQGWNRMAIIGLGSFDRCTLRPATRQGALDTLRGMARFGNPLAYQECMSNSECAACPLANKAREAWNNDWHIRQDMQGFVWLLGNIKKGFAGFGYAHKDWATLMAQIEVPMLKRQQDSQGWYWIAA